MKEVWKAKTALYQTAFEKTQDIILILQPDGNIVEANPAAVEAYGYSCQELLDKTIYDLRADKDNALVTTQIGQILSSPYQFEAVHRRKDGTVFPVEVSSHNQDFEGETVIFSIIRDVSARKQVENRLRYLATHDSLTNVPNRYLFEQVLQHAVAQAKKGDINSLLFLDIDNFKIVNDTFGHLAGDQLLVNIVNILQRTLRKHDILARLGGDEFAILLSGTDTAEAGIVAEKLRAAVEEAELCLNMYGTYFKPTISIGIVGIDGHVSSQDLLADVDAALYRAKGCGKNCVRLG